MYSLQPIVCFVNHYTAYDLDSNVYLRSLETVETGIVNSAQYSKRGWEYQLAEADGQIGLQGHWAAGSNLYPCKKNSSTTLVSEISEIASETRADGATASSTRKQNRAQLNGKKEVLNMQLG